MKGSAILLYPYQRRWLQDKSAVKLWVASRQIGKSFALSLEAVTEAMEARCDNLILSSSERQAQEVMSKVRRHLRVLGAMFNAEVVAGRQRREEIELSNGSRIISLPANPATVRGFSGHVYLDEFAFHTDSREIWRAMYPAVTRGYRVRIASTPAGRHNLFYELARGTGDTGDIAVATAAADTGAAADHVSALISQHRTPIHDAVADGLEVDVAALRKGIADPEAWAQEYECRFVDSATALLPYELIANCETLAGCDLHGAGADLMAGPEAQGAGRQMESASERMERGGTYYLGLDVGRTHDLTVFWLLEKVGDVLWTRMVRELRDVPFSAQRTQLNALMELEAAGGGHAIKRVCIDATGIGAQLAEEAAERFGSRVEPVGFTQAVKEEMALRVRRAFEDRAIRVPAARGIREDLHSIMRTLTTSGNARFDAARGRGGHADRFWALALALESASNTGAAVVEYSQLERRTLLRQGGCW